MDKTKRTVTVPVSDCDHFSAGQIRKECFNHDLPKHGIIIWYESRDLEMEE